MLDAGVAMKIELAQNALDPDIDGKDVHPAIGKQENAICNFFAHALDSHEFLACFCSRKSCDSLKGDFAGSDLSCSNEEMPGPEAELAGAQFRLSGQRQTRGLWKEVEALANLVAEHTAQFMVDLLDLHDLLEGRADEIAECLPRFLTEDPQTGSECTGGIEMWIAGEGGKDFRDWKIEPEVAGDSSAI